MCLTLKHLAGTIRPTSLSPLRCSTGARPRSVCSPLQSARGSFVTAPLIRPSTSSAALSRTAAPTTAPTASAAMAPKRKTTPADKKETASDETLTPQEAAAQVRRSSRRINTRNQPPVHPLEEADMSKEGRIMGVRTADGDETPGDMDVEDGKALAKESMQQAIEGLARMERQLKRATKRQKLQVEESTFWIPREPPAGHPFNPAIPRKSKAEEAAEPSKDGRLRTPDKQTAKSDDEDGSIFDVETEAMDLPEEGLEAPERGAARPPAVHSSYLPLPWKGRLGYACLNTYLRSAKPPVFSSRTCRMASIIDHRCPLQDPTQPEHHTKNRPDKSQEPAKELALRFVQQLGLANAGDMVKMLRWNDKYGIRFMRLSSDMFPFASHPEHGYKLAPFASEVLAEAGKVAAGLGHRLTTHPGQFTQLGSPRKEVVTAAVRDLEYHDELLSLLRLPDQQDRDAVMILHMGGVFGDKSATLDRFRENYAKLSDSIKARLVLENDDVAWSVHDLLPICEELNIPLVLDYHHHNIIFDSDKCREGTLDISQPEISERIAATWKRKGIKQKMHYSEPCAGAVTPRDRRKHSPRVATLPPCPPDTDLMIEAKDKEQAVFELMRTFKLPGFERINDMIPFERDDESRPAPKTPKKKKAGALRRKRALDEDPVDLDDADAGADDQESVPKAKEVSAQDFAMGGPLNRVYWPPGREEWLKPPKRSLKQGVVNEDDVV